MLTCRNLLDTDYFYQCFDLCTGEDGLDKRILWFYVDDHVSGNKIFGQETNLIGNLIFLHAEFVRKTVAEQISFLHQCIKNQVAGIVIIEVEHLRISSKLIQEAENKKLPIFTLKKAGQFSHVLKMIVQMITQEENKEEYKTVFMSEILSQKLDSLPMILARGDECGINLRNLYCFMSLKIDVKKDENHHSGYYYLEIMHSILPKIEYMCVHVKMLKYFSFERGICLFQIEDKKQFEKIRNKVDGFLKQFYQDNGVLVKAGFSNTHVGAQFLSLAYEESQEAVQAAMKTLTDIMTVQYEEMSILRFLVNLAKEDRNKLIDVAKNRMEPLVDYDQKNGTDLLNTCYEYLRVDSNLLEASKILYIHRNTLMKRLKKIEELLQKDLKDFQVKWDTYNSIYVLKHFGIL